MENPRQEAREAFDKAINDSRLTTSPNDNNYAGKYMFMGKKQGKDLFKNILTRAYDV